MSTLLEEGQRPNPGGVLDQIQIHASRREIVQLCGDKGITLYSFLLASSIKDPSQEQGVVFCLQRLCDIALHLGWSPDTVKRYIAVFRAINLVSHYHDQRREVKIQLPLGPYIPLTTFTALDELVSKRAKQRQLALKVKFRYIACFGDPTQGHSDKMRQTLQQIKTILDDERLEPLKKERLHMKIAEMISCLTGIEREHTQEGDPNASSGGWQADSLRQKLDTASSEGDLNAQGGDLDNHTASSAQHAKEHTEDSNAQEGDLDAQGGDSTSSTSLSSGTGVKQEGDSKANQGDQTPSIPFQEQETQHQTGDSDASEGDLKEHNNSHVGDSTQQSTLNGGDSAAEPAGEVQVNAPYTYNVSYLISNIKGDNAIRKRIAQFLAKTLEKSEYENGYPTFSKYLKAFKYYSPDVIGRAFLVTMVLVHRKNWQVESLGATFTNQCKILSGQKPLAHYTLDEVEEWMRSWGHLAYPELVVAIAAPAEQQVPNPASLITGPQKVAPKGLEFSSRLPSNITKRKRTFGVAYTGRPTPVNKGIHSLSSPARPPEKS